MEKYNVFCINFEAFKIVSTHDFYAGDFIVSTYFLPLFDIRQYTVISWLRGEQSNYCPEVVEKIWETVARGRRPRATVSQIFSITEGQWFDCSPSSLEITVLLPNCFKSAKHCQQYADTRR